jgi:hypothetical protein
MKWMFFLLLAASLALAAFTYVRERLPNPDAQIIKSQLKADQIRIVEPRERPAPAPVASMPVPGRCLEWGSFGAGDLPKAQAALDVLELGELVRKVEVSVATSYWVYIPPLRSRADMDKKINELKDLGVKG